LLRPRLAADYRSSKHKPNEDMTHMGAFYALSSEGSTGFGRSCRLGTRGRLMAIDCVISASDPRTLVSPGWV
jgi:hypothetical protein